MTRRHRSPLGRLGLLRLVRDRRGVVSIEFALLSPVLLLILVMLADFGLAFHEQMQLESATRAGLQLAVWDHTDTDTIRTAVLAATDLPAAEVAVDVATRYDCNGTAGSFGTPCTDGSWPAAYVTVTASKRFNAIFTIYGLEEFFDLQGSAEGRVH